MKYPVEIKLMRPVTVDGKTFAALVFDEPDLGTMIAVEEADTNIEKTTALLMGMADVSRSVMLKVKGADFQEITKRVLEPYNAEQAEKHGVASGNAEATT